MFATHKRESPATRRRRGKEELSNRANRLLGVINDHMARAHPPLRRRRAHDGRIRVSDSGSHPSSAKGKERVEGSSLGESTDSSSRPIPAVCHVEDMVQCVEQLNLLWDWVVVFGGKEQIQEVFLTLPMIETLMRLLKRHPQAPALFTRCAQFLGPLVTENIAAKMRFEQAKGVRVFGLAYQDFGPWVLCSQQTTSPPIHMDEVTHKAVAAGVARMGVASASQAMGEQDKMIASLEAKNAAEVREIRLLLEKHAAFESIRELLFCITKSIAVLSSRHPQEEAYLQRLKQKVNKMVYRPQLIERRMIFMSRHILGYSILWTGLKAEFDQMRKEYSNLHSVSLPTTHFDPSASPLPLPQDNLYETEETLAPRTVSTSSDSKSNVSSQKKLSTEKHNLISAKTKAMMCAEVREQKLEQVLCQIQLMEVRVDQLSPEVDEDGYPIRDRNPFVVIQQWRWKEAPRRQQPALWKSTIARHNHSPVWELRHLGYKESSYVLAPRVSRRHKAHQAVSSFIYRRNPIAKTLSKFQLWRQRRKVAKKKKKTFNTVTTVGAASDDRLISIAKEKPRKKVRKSAQSQPQHHHHNPKHIPKRVKTHVKARRHSDEPRDPAITTVVREMHNCFRARFFPPLKVSVYDWVSPDHQEFLGRVEIDPAVIFLLEKEANAMRKRMDIAATDEAMRADARAVHLRNEFLSNRGRRGSFLWEMIESEDSDNETETDDETDRTPHPQSTDGKHDRDPLKEIKEHERRTAAPSTPHPGDQTDARRLDAEHEEMDKAEERDEAARMHNELARVRERDDIRREASANRSDLLASSTVETTTAPVGQPTERPREDLVGRTHTPDEPPAVPATNDQATNERKGSIVVVDGDDLKKRRKLEERQRKKTVELERKQKRKEEQERKRKAQEQRKEENRRKEEAKKAMRRMSKDATTAATEPAPQEKEHGITVVLPLYAGEEERYTPGVERHHYGVTGCISLTLSVSAPHWSASRPSVTTIPVADPGYDVPS